MTEIKQLSDLTDDFDAEYRQRVKEQSKKVAKYILEQAEPLWQRIGGKTGPYDLGPTEIANILNLIADEVELRGDIDYDRDPGETAEWLRHQAMISESAIQH